MKAIQLNGFEGIDSLRLVDIPAPVPAADEVLIKVKAAGINYAEVEQIRGKYPANPLPFVMGFEVAGTVAAVGANASSVRIGARVAAVVGHGGYAEFATASAAALIPIPDDLSYADATTIPIQGMSAYALLKYLVLPVSPRSVLIQAAAGGVGLFLVQLSKLMGVENVIAMASNTEKLQLVRTLGADTAINYAEAGWQEKVLATTGGKGVDVVLQMATDHVGEESFKLAAFGGRIVLFGSKNYHDTITTEQVRQLIWKNQSLVGYAYPALPQAQIAESLPEFLQLVREKRIKLFATRTYPLAEVKAAFSALISRNTIGKLVLEP